LNISGALSPPPFCTWFLLSFLFSCACTVPWPGHIRTERLCPDCFRRDCACIFPHLPSLGYTAGILLLLDVVPCTACAARMRGYEYASIRYSNGSSGPGWELFPIPDITLFPSARGSEETQNAGMAEEHTRVIILF
jgi:hypothetical protein